MVNAYDKAEPGVFCGDCEVKYYETCAFNVHDPVIVRYFENSCKWEKFQAENGEGKCISYIVNDIHIY